jgi:hypothetical protein
MQRTATVSAPTTIAPPTIPVIHSKKNTGISGLSRGVASCSLGACSMSQPIS